MRFIRTILHFTRFYTVAVSAATFARAETFDSAVIFRYAGYIMHVKAGIP